MEIKYSPISVWIYALLAMASCSLHQMVLCRPQQLPSQQPCSSDLNTKLNITLDKVSDTFNNVSAKIEGFNKRLKLRMTQDNTHFENLPYERTASRSTRNTMIDLYALKQYWKKSSPSDEGGLSTDLGRLICSMAYAEDVQEEIMVALPIVTDDDFSGTLSRYNTLKRDYRVARDILSYLHNLRSQTCFS